MHELKHRLGGSRGGQLLSHVVLNSFHVMVRARFDRLHGRGSVGIRLARELARTGDNLRAERGAGKLGHRRGQMHQPLRLDPNALADQAGFREKFTQRLGGRAVATVYRRKCVDG